MVFFDERSWWLASTNLLKWPPARLNELLWSIVRIHRLSFAEFFEMGAAEWQDGFGLSPKEAADLEQVKDSRNRYVDLIQELDGCGIELIPAWSEAYPKKIKKNVPQGHFPPILYTLGNPRLLYEPSCCVLGSQSSSAKVVEFIRKVVEKFSQEDRTVVVSMAKGLDRVMLDLLTEFHCKTVVVAAQGLLTVTGFLDGYRKQIDEGELTCLSGFYPKDSWNMEREVSCLAQILGLTDDLYVAKTSPDDSLWAEVIEQLKRGRRVFVRSTASQADNAHDPLVLKGAVPLDENGSVMASIPRVVTSPLRQLRFSCSEDTFEGRVRRYLSSRKDPVSARQIKEDLLLKVEMRQLLGMLKRLEFVVAKKASGTTQFYMKKESRKSLL